MLTEKELHKEVIDTLILQHKKVGVIFNPSKMITRTLEGYQNLKHLDPSFEPDFFIEMNYDTMKPLLSLIPTGDLSVLLASDNYIVSGIARKEYDSRNG
jgi:hypothetical protein